MPRLLKEASALAIQVGLLGVAWGALEASYLFASQLAPWQARNPGALPALVLAGSLHYGLLGLLAGITGACLWTALLGSGAHPDRKCFVAAFTLFTIVGCVVLLGPFAMLRANLRSLGHPAALILSIGVVGADAAAGWLLYRRLRARGARSASRFLSPAFLAAGTLAAAALLILAGEVRALFGSPAPEIKDAVELALAAGRNANGFKPAPARADRGRPNVLLITIDTLRADHLNAWGYRVPEVSPILDRVAREGVRFRHAFAPSSWTRPSMASLFTSLYPLQHGLEESNKNLPAGVRTLPAEVGALGYHTTTICTNPLRALDPNFGFQEVYTEFPVEDPYSISAVQPTRFRIARLYKHLQRRIRLVLPEEDGEYDVDAERVNRMAFAWLQRAPGPFLLHLHYMDPHEPYLEHPLRAAQWEWRAAWNREALLRQYDGEIRFLDRKLGELFAEIDRLSLADDLLTVVTADHGEEFLEHGGWGHQHTLYDELLRVPLIIRWPGRLPGGLVVDEPVNLVDIAPTILDLLGGAAPAEWEGSPLTPLMRGEGGRERPILSQLLVRHRPGKTVRRADSILDGGFKLIRGVRVQRATELFDLGEDPEERRDLSAERPEVVMRLAHQLDVLLASLQANSLRPTTRELSLEERERLRALGYVQ